MASVTIYAEHRDMLDALITTGKVASAAGATKTGPFKAQRDAFVFAAAVAIAAGEVVGHDAMPTSRKNATTIRDSVFLGADGAEELCWSAALIDGGDAETAYEGLKRRLRVLTEEELEARLLLLDRYAYAGFELLVRRQEDEGTIRELVLTVLDEITCSDTSEEATEDVRDPLWEVLSEDVES